jgi:EmrB/QacA subfamily drug resistance transporter
VTPVAQVPTSATRHERLVAPRLQIAMGVLCLVLFLTFLDNTIVSVTLANVQSSLHTGVSELQWIVNGYALVFASLMLTAGALGDLFGRKRVMLVGIGIFSAGSVLCAIAPNATLLVAGRAVMGVGAAASEPGTLSMLRHLFPDGRRRARALGVWVAVASLALALGPVIGGTLVGLWSWRAVFWFNLALGVVAFAAGLIVLPEHADPVPRRLDVVGFALGAITLGALSFAIITGETQGYRTWWIVLLFVVAGAGAAAFFTYEQHAANPALDVRYLRQPAFAGATIVAFVSYFGIFAVFFFTALYLQVVAAVSPYSTAVDFLPMATAMILASLLTGRWVARSGPRRPMTIGCILAGVGLLLTDLVLTPHAGLTNIGWTLAMAGAGFGMAVVPVTTAAMSAIPPEHSGMAASTTNTSRELGAVVGVAVLGSMVNAQLTVSLTNKLVALGIPAQYRELVINAVTNGTFGSSVGAAEQIKQYAPIIRKIVAAAYGAFATGLDYALLTAGALLLACAFLALAVMPDGPPRAEGDLADEPDP